MKLIEDRYKKYNPKNKNDEKNALREIAHEIALSALARTDFFKEAAFFGGSCLRIVHGLNRFSEDLDFSTFRPIPKFRWHPYLLAMEAEFKAHAFDMTITDREEVEGKVRRAFLKKDSMGKILTLKYTRKYTDNEVLKIKFEIDTSPPAGSSVEINSLDFPYPFSFTTLDKPSLFASKIAALFDRSREKGRHWFDFLWYVSQKWPINFTLLSDALKTKTTLDSLIQQLTTLVQSIDWKKMRKDVEQFISVEEQETLEMWNAPFFLGHLEGLSESLRPTALSLGSLIAEGKGLQLLDAVKKALQSGTSPDDDSRNGHRPLQLAISKGEIAIAKLLIDAGADLNHRDRSGQTPIQTAVNKGQFELARLLIQKGAMFNPNASNLGFDQAKLYQFRMGF
jgi:predicted nucleotidyltransferase component of viral defense system